MTISSKCAGRITDSHKSVSRNTPPILAFRFSDCLLKICWQIKWQSVNLLAEIPIWPFHPADFLTVSSKCASRLRQSVNLPAHIPLPLFLSAYFLTVSSKSAGRLTDSQLFPDCLILLCWQINWQQIWHQKFPPHFGWQISWISPNQMLD